MNKCLTLLGASLIALSLTAAEETRATPTLEDALEAAQTFGLESGDALFERGKSGSRGRVSQKKRGG